MNIIETVKSSFKTFWIWLGDISLRLVLLVGMIIVFAAGVYLSWRHTWHMAERHGFTTDEAMIFTVLVETLLIVSELVIIFRATMDKPIHVSVYVGVGVAVIINLVGNVSSFWEVSEWGVALGASITLITAIAVWIFATALTEDKTDRQQTNVRDTDNETGKTLSDSDIMDTREQDRQDDSDKLDKTLTVDELMRQFKPVPASLLKKETEDNETVQTIDTTQTSTSKTEQNNIKTDISYLDKDTDDNLQIQDKQTDKIDSLVSTTDTNKTPTTKTTSDRQQTVSSDKTKTDKQDSANKKTKLSLVYSDKEKLARQTARDYFQKNEKYPSYRELGNMVGMSKDKAGEIIKELKTNIS